MKLRILSQHFYPDSASVGNLLTQLATGLALAGFDVEVFTSQPRDDSKSHLPEYEIYNSVKIYRLSTFRFNRHKKSGMTINYLNYFIKTLFKVFITKNKEKVIYMIVTNPPFLSFIGVLLNYFKKIKFIYLLYDILPDSYINMNFVSSKSLYVKLWQYLNKLAYKTSAGIVVNSDKMKETVENKLFDIYKNKERFNKVTVITNWADEEYLHPIPIENNIFIKQNNLQNKFIINYSGTLGVLQDFTSLIEAAKILINEDINFLFIGDGTKRINLTRIKEENGLNNIHFYPYQNEEIYPYSQAASHLSIIHLLKEVEGLCMPSKLYSILAAGNPVLAFCETQSELGKIVTEANCGFVVNNEKTDDIINSIFKLKNNKELEVELRKNARALFEKYYTKKRALHNYETLINSLNL